MKTRPNLDGTQLLGQNTRTFLHFALFDELVNGLRAYQSVWCEWNHTAAAHREVCFASFPDQMKWTADVTSRLILY